MPGPNWGRKGETKLEDDALFKAIGGQLGGEKFDYSQWQRTVGKSPKGSVSSQKDVPKPSSAKSVHSVIVKRPDTTLTTASLSSAAPTLASLRRIGSADTCHHGRRLQLKKTLSPAEEEEHKRKVERIKVLQLRIRARKQILADYRKRYHELLEINIKLKDKIDSEEGKSHADVKHLLRKYEKFRGGISTLNEKFSTEYSQSKSELEKLKARTEIDLAGWQQQVDAIDEKLKEKQRELNILMNYKDKEYPMKSLQIAELQKEINDLKVLNQEEINELQHIVDSEMDKYKKERHKATKSITETVSQEFLEKMHPTWKDMATQNLVMQKEIEYHRKEQEDIKEVIHNLNVEIKKLLWDPKTNIRQQMFPHFFPPEQKCTPDMEVVLDIPTQQWLPI